MNEDPGKLNLSPKEDSQPSPVVDVPKQPIISNFLLIPMVVLALILLASTGYLAFQNYQLRKEISQLQSSPSPTPDPDPTANWKTYASTAFSFKYDQSLYFDQSTAKDTKVTLYNKNPRLPNQENVYYLGFVSTQNTTFDKQINLIKQGNQNITYTSNKLNDYTIYEVEGIPSPGGVNEIKYFIEGNNILTEVHLRNITDVKEAEYLGFLDTATKILSTFKFLPNTSNWKTYIDSFHNYTIKYPRELSVEPTPSENSGVAEFRGEVNGENKYLAIGIGGVDTKQLDPSIKIIEEKDIEIGNIEMHRQILSPSRQTNFAILYTFTTGKIWYFAEWFSNDYQAEVEYYEQILSTFKSTN